MHIFVHREDMGVEKQDIHCLHDLSLPLRICLTGRLVAVGD